MALLLHLQRTGGATAPDLARALEVSVRTVYRDVAALQEAGVPLWTEPGPRGGIRLVEGWRTQLDGLTGDEAGALFLAGAPAAAAELGLGRVLAAAQVKVLATLPPELRARAGRVRERFHLDAPGWFAHDESPLHLAPVARALWDDRRLQITYERDRRSQAVVRIVDPLGLVLKAGTWYLVAHHRHATHTYRVDRIVDATVLAERFERPAFDLAAAWGASAEQFSRSILRSSVRLRLSPSGQRRLRHAVDPAAAARALDRASPAAERDSGVELDLQVESEEVAFSQLLGLGAQVEIVAPATLRARFAAEAGAMTEHYRRQAGSIATRAE